MAIGSQVPPRAYTREILTTAFNWLQTQPEAARAKATTPDALVALYMQATNNVGGRFDRTYGGQSSLETDAPVSSQAFMSDLKNLAVGLKEFDDSKSIRAPQARPAMPQHASDTRLSTSEKLQPNPGFPVSHHVGEHRVPTAAATVSAPVTTSSVPQTATAAPLRTQQLNEKSLAMLREVQVAMNLSSETEAINMMIAVAYKNLKSVIA